MRQPISTCAVILSLIFIFVCTPALSNPNFTGDDQYNSIWVGWFDLGEQNYKNLGYESQVDWENEIKKQNIFLQEYIRYKMKGWKIYGANVKTDEPPKDTGVIVIRFKNTVFDTLRTVKSSGIISTDAEYIDATSKKVIKTLEQKELSAILGWVRISLAGRLNDAMSRIAYDVCYYLAQ